MAIIGLYDLQTLFFWHEENKQISIWVLINPYN
jgi:hypothetical protein